MEIDKVLFDLGEVYLMGMIGAEEAIAAGVGADKADVWRHINGEKLVRLFTGQSSEREYWREVIAEGCYPREVDGEPTAEFLMRAMRGNFHEIDGTADIVRALKKAGYGVGLISDHVREWIEYCRTAFPLDELFSVQCYSFDCGSTKKHHLSFMHALERMGADPNSVLVVDDNPRNLYVAQQHPVNIRYAHHFTGAKSLRDALPEYGIHLY